MTDNDIIDGDVIGNFMMYLTVFRLSQYLVLGFQGVLFVVLIRKGTDVKCLAVNKYN